MLLPLPIICETSTQPNCVLVMGGHREVFWIAICRKWCCAGTGKLCVACFLETGWLLVKSARDIQQEPWYMCTTCWGAKRVQAVQYTHRPILSHNTWRPILLCIFLSPTQSHGCRIIWLGTANQVGEVTVDFMLGLDLIESSKAWK